MTQQPAAAKDAANNSGRFGGRTAQQSGQGSPQEPLKQPRAQSRQQLAPASEPPWQQSASEVSEGGAVPWPAGLELAEGQHMRVDMDTDTSQLDSTAKPPWGDTDGRAGSSGGSANSSSGGDPSKESIMLLDDREGGSLGDGRSDKSQWQRLLQGCCGEVDERVAALAAFAAFMALSHTSLHAVFPSFVRVRSTLLPSSRLTKACRQAQHGLRSAEGHVGTTTQVLAVDM